MMKDLLGEYLVEISGAAPERCLNRLTGKDIPFRRLRRTDEFHLQVRLRIRDWDRAEREILAGLCTAEILEIHSPVRRLTLLRRRPVLILGMLLSLALAFFAQSRIWFLKLDCPEEIPREQILRALAEDGVCFGAKAVGLDTQRIKNRMLNQVPSLRWIGVSRDGGVVHVACSARVIPEDRPADTSPANVVALRDGVVTEVTVYSGFPAVEPGQAVTAGQLLVSGLANWTTHTQATHASADVEALTMRSVSACTPDSVWKKVYTGRTETCRTLVFEQKRIKLSGNSGIFGMSCDKMIETKQLTLPGGYSFPAWLETVRLSEYELRRSDRTQNEAERLMELSAKQMVRGEMTAGTVESSELSIRKEAGCYQAEIAFSCREMISRTSPIYLFGEEEYNGKNHQRGTNGADYQRIRFLR